MPSIKQQDCWLLPPVNLGHAHWPRILGENNHCQHTSFDKARPWQPKKAKLVRDRFNIVRKLTSSCLYRCHLHIFIRRKVLADSPTTKGESEVDVDRPTLVNASGHLMSICGPSQAVKTVLAGTFGRLGSKSGDSADRHVLNSGDWSPSSPHILEDTRCIMWKRVARYRAVVRHPIQRLQASDCLLRHAFSRQSCAIERSGVSHKWLEGALVMARCPRTSCFESSCKEEICTRRWRPI